MKGKARLGLVGLGNFSTNIGDAKELIDSGAIGKPAMVEANTSRGADGKLSPNEFRWCGDDSALVRAAIESARTGKPADLEV